MVILAMGQRPLFPPMKEQSQFIMMKAYSLLNWYLQPLREPEEENTGQFPPYSKEKLAQTPSRGFF